MTKPIRTVVAYSASEIRSIPESLQRELEVILLPSKGRYIFDASSVADDDGDLVLAPDEACRCCDGSGRWLRWAISAEGGEGGGVTDHGALTGLGDDDHPQYTDDAEAAAIAAAEVADHEAESDPHPDYTTEAEVIALIAANVPQQSWAKTLMESD